MSDPALVIGEALIDEVHRGSTVERHPGGSPANVALTLARLGAAPTLLSQWGPDDDGAALASHLTAAGVAIAHGTVQDAPTSRAIATLSEANEATYDFELTWDVKAKGDLGRYAHVHTGSIATVLEPGATTVREVVERLSERATVSVDPNARPSLMGEPDRAWQRVSDVLEYADVVKASDEDVEWFTEGGSQDDFAEDLLAGGAALVIITRGATGVRAYTHAGEVERPAFEVRVADTVGAGDSLMGGVIDALTRLNLTGADNRDALAALTTGQVSDILTWASAVAALTVSRAGANPPSATEVRRLLENADQLPAFVRSGSS
ncbi:MAG: carbohydrate kinase [Bowdeniella nasicola]|nr:carbohydrate kinase [Bowdeniella nasicola]